MNNIVNNTLDVYTPLINKILKLNCHFKNYYYCYSSSHQNSKTKSQLAPYLRPQLSLLIYYDYFLVLSIVFHHIEIRFFSATRRSININWISVYTLTVVYFQEFFASVICKIILKYIDVINARGVRPNKLRICHYRKQF